MAFRDMYIHSILIAAAYAKLGVYQLRFKQARARLRLNRTLPFTKPAEPAGFSTVGWTTPGKFPRPADGAAWLAEVPEEVPEEVPAASYAIAPSPETCFSTTERHATSKTCYTPIASAFYWGETVALSYRINCVTQRYNFSLVSPELALSTRVLTDLNEEHFPTLPKPPQPWHLVTNLRSRVAFRGSMPGFRSGFFWHKPLFWAVAYAGYRISLTERTTSAHVFRSTYIYPVTRDGRIEGLYGFQPSLSPVSDYIEPEQIEYYPS